MRRHSKVNRVSAFGLRPSFGFRTSAFGFLILALALQPPPVLACAACAGQSDAPMARGMNWGILSLLAVVAVVLASFAVFFIYLARRAAAAAATSAKPNPGRASVPASPNFSGHLQTSRLVGTLALPGSADSIL